MKGEAEIEGTYSFANGDRHSDGFKNSSLREVDSSVQLIVL
jgi:hypothetical protein